MLVLIMSRSVAGQAGLSFWLKALEVWSGSRWWLSVLDFTGKHQGFKSYAPTDRKPVDEDFEDDSGGDTRT